MPPRVLCLLAHGFEEIETVTPVDLLRRAGVEVVIAAISPGPITGRSGITLVPDALLDSIDTGNFDALLLPGGPGVDALRRDGRAAELARRFHREGRTLAAICAAPLILADAGLLTGCRFTAHASTLPSLPQSTGSRVEEDGLLITSRGAGTAVDFGLALVRRLAGGSHDQAIHAAIMA